MGATGDVGIDWLAPTSGVVSALEGAPWLRMHAKSSSIETNVVAVVRRTNVPALRKRTSIRCPSTATR